MVFPGGHCADNPAGRGARTMHSELVPVKTADGHAVLQMAAAAGVPPECFEELVTLGLVSTAEPGGAPTEPMAADSLLPAAGDLLPESEHGGFDDQPLDPLPDELVDLPLEQAKDLLLRTLRQEAPVAGSLTMMKLRRASSRAEVAALLPEVEQRLRGPRRQLMVDQLLRQAKYLLSLPLVP